MSIFFEKLYIRIRNFKNKHLSRNRVNKVKPDFSIISNNCWGGLVYQYFGMEYLTPTVGLFFFPEDYLNFCKDFRRLMDCELVSVPVNQSNHSQEIKEQIKAGILPDNLVIGAIGSVEICFLHYHSFDEAYNKWNRRKQRINYQRLIFKFNDNNGITKSHFEQWEELKLDRKLFITNKKSFVGDDVLYVNHGLPNNNGVNDTTFLDKDLNLIDFINSNK